MRLDAPFSRFDGWANVLTGIGHETYDKRLGASWIAGEITYETAEALWRGGDMEARIVELIPSEMLREGFALNIADDAHGKEISEAVMARLDELDANNKLIGGLQRERAYGGGAVLMSVDDGAASPAEPLDLARVRSVRGLNLLDPRDLWASSWYSDPWEPRYGEPERYRLQAATPMGGSAAAVDVHESRLIVFPGPCVSVTRRVGLGGWGDSVFLRTQEALRDFSQAYAGVAILLQDVSQATLKIEGLAQLIATNGVEAVRARLRALELSRSVARLALLDATEQFERVATPLAGVPDLLDRFCLRLAAAADMPVSLLMGREPAGLNATGESDIRGFYDRVRARQGTHLRPRLNRLIQVLLSERDGATKGREPEKWEVEFKPLRQQSANEIAAYRKLVAEVDWGNITAGIVTPEEVAISRYGGDAYSPEMTIDVEAREQMKAEREATPPPRFDPQTGAPVDPMTGQPMAPVATTAPEVNSPAAE